MKMKPQYTHDIKIRKYFLIRNIMLTDICPRDERFTGKKFRTQTETKSNKKLLVFLGGGD
jgi:hypothetical protein